MKESTAAEKTQDVETPVPALPFNVSPEPKMVGSFPGSDFTGVARSIQCYLNNGEFKNFRILTLTINKGKVTKVHYSDPYASFELIAKLEFANEMAMLALNNTWEDGKIIFK